MALFVVVTGCGRVGFDALPAGDDARGDGIAIDAPTFTPSRSAYLKAPAPAVNDQFGAGLALSADGSTLAVGAYGDASSAGAVYVFVRDNDVWSLQARVAPQIADAGDNFGTSVALSADGNTLVAGAFVEDSAVILDPSDNMADAAGAAYVFVRSGTTWSQQAYLKALNVDAGDQFGQSVALSASGDIAAVGAHYEASVSQGSPADNNAPQSGALYVFTRTGMTWGQTGYIKADNAGGGDNLGESLDMTRDGNLIVAGAYLESSAATGVDGDGTNDFVVNSGAAYVFEGPPWTQRAYIKAINTDMSDEFGVTVGISADGTVAAGTHLEASATVTNPADNSLLNAGAAYIYGRGMTAWQPEAYLKAPSPATSALYGLRIAISDAANTLVVGAIGEDNVAGAAYVYTRIGADWGEPVRLTATNRDSGDSFGSVAVSADGATVAIGAYLEAGNGVSPADNSVSSSGAVYVFW